MSSRLLIKFTYIQPDPEPVLLDAYPGATAAYSFRKLRNEYAGPCCGIRRSSDNAELDVYFVDNYVDLDSIYTFVGSDTNCFITKMFDQANSNDIEQSTAVSQPLLKSIGTYQLQNGFTAPLFNNGPHLFINGLITAYPIHNFLVATNQSDSDNGFVVSGSEDTSTNFKYFADFINVTSPSASGRMREAGGSTTDELNVGTRDSGVLKQASFLHLNLSDKTVSVNGTSASSTAFDENPFPIDNYAIGTIKRPTGFSGVTGYFCENIVYLTDQSANEAAITANQIAYYGIL